jgi:hypothetical protein
MKPCKILFKKNTQTKEGKKKTNQLAREKKEQLAIGTWKRPFVNNDSKSQIIIC